MNRLDPTDNGSPADWEIPVWLSATGYSRLLNLFPVGLLSDQHRRRYLPMSHR